MIKNLQVWVVFGSLVLLAVVAMVFVTRSNMVIERSRSAAETRALLSRLETERDRQLSQAIRMMDRELARLLSMESHRSPERYLVSSDDVALPNASAGQSSYCMLYFSRLKDQDWVTQWSINGQPVDQLLPSLKKGSPQQWEQLWHSTARDWWMPGPDVVYKVNRTFQLVINGQAESNTGGWQGQLDLGQLLPSVDLQNPAAEKTGAMFPVWIDDQLCLFRWAETSEGGQIQGCVLHWERLQDSLLRTMEQEYEIRPNLIPVLHDFPGADQSSYSAWIPARIELPLDTLTQRPYPSDGGWVLLALGWLFLLVSCAAVGLLLQTVLKMSNRREAFVSSVTHELRTPLTTFRLYADLLAKAPNPEKTREYAKTLQSEAERLSHLVENVLCYSRMEKRGITSHHRVTAIGELLDAMVPRLEEHCFRSGMILDYADATPQIRRTEILTDPSAVDRILVNLVDNACKYGRTEESQIVELKVKEDGKWLLLEVADQGPGLAKNQRRRLFKAYNHGHIGAESPNTTIGLGLNICFNLAKALGGSLSFEDNHPGCRFLLRIPMDLQRR